jgi:hypothetical protein
VSRSYDKTLTIAAGRGGGTVVDVAIATGEASTSAFFTAIQDGPP